MLIPIIMMQNKNLLHKAPLRKCHLSVLHFIAVFEDKGTAPGGKCTEQPNVTYSLFEKFFILSYFSLLIHLKVFYFSYESCVRTCNDIWKKKDIKKNIFLYNIY